MARGLIPQGDQDIYGEGLLKFFNAYRDSAKDKKQQDMQEQAMAQQLAQQQAQGAHQERQMQLAQAKEGRESDQFSQKMGFEERKLGQELGVKRQDLALKVKDSGNKLLDKEFDLSQKFSHDPTVKRTAEMSEAVNRMKSGAEAKNAAGDISLIFGFMKLNDPTSTVREGEFATAQNAGSVPDNVRKAYNKAISGERLGDKERSMFYNQGVRLFKAQTEAQAPIEEQYGSFSKDYGVNPNRVVRKYEVPGLMETPAEPPGLIEQARGFLGGSPSTGQDSIPSAVAAPTPKVGTVKGGYRFKGGAPGEESSWELVK